MLGLTARQLLTTKTHHGLYAKVELPLKVFQTAAIMEVSELFFLTVVLYSLHNPITGNEVRLNMPSGLEINTTFSEFWI